VFAVSFSAQLAVHEVVAEIDIHKSFPFAVDDGNVVLVDVEVFKDWVNDWFWSKNLEFLASFSNGLCYEVCEAFVACFRVILDVLLDLVYEFSLKAYSSISVHRHAYYLTFALYIQ